MVGRSRKPARNSYDRRPGDFLARPFHCLVAWFRVMLSQSGKLSLTLAIIRQLFFGSTCSGPHESKFGLPAFNPVVTTLRRHVFLYQREGRITRFFQTRRSVVNE
jgi:hypothetical protein